MHAARPAAAQGVQALAGPAAEQLPRAPRRRPTTVAAVLAATLLVTAASAGTATGLPLRGPSAYELCEQARGGDKCQDGGGRQTPGGGEKVSHKGWPRITGVFWQVTGTNGRRFRGGAENDELLGHHGSDRIRGGDGKDVIWGDWNPRNNTTRQRDRLSGEGGADWIYSSHGVNTIRGGGGKDYIWAYYGRGTIDCGSGFDTLRVRLVNGYRHTNCEKIKNFCAFGSKPGNQGGCYKPGEKPRSSARRVG